MEQKPSVGRIVHFVPPQECTAPATLAFYPAIITQVNEKPPVGIRMEPIVTCELATFGPNSLYFQHGIPFSEEPKPGHWNWPPRV